MREIVIEEDITPIFHSIFGHNHFFIFFLSPVTVYNLQSEKYQISMALKEANCIPNLISLSNCITFYLKFYLF